MTPEQYCYEKALKPGSPFYYSLRKCSRSQRDAIAAIAAFYQEMTDVVLECHDPGVAYVKLNWWRSEIEKCNEGKPDHPVMLALQKSREYFPISPQRLMDLIDGVEQSVNSSLFATFEEITLHVIHTAGVRELLIADVLRADESVSAEIVYQLTLVVELVEHIQHLRRYVRHGIIFFAQDELDKFHVNAALLQAYKTTDEIRNLLRYQAEKVERAYAKVVTELTPAMRLSLSSLSVRCEIALRTLCEIQTSQFSVLENLISLTPLRCWWIASKYNFYYISYG